MGIVSFFKGLVGNTLYYPGCLTKGVRTREFENYKEIFKKLGINYILLSDVEVCCGLPVLNAGFKKDSRDLAKKNLKIFHDYSVKKIITNCPSCYHMFHDVYPSLVRDWDVEVEHATVSILKALNHKKIKNEGDKEKVSYHDPCHLGRYSGIYEEPRKVIELLGGELVEYKHNRENAVCCGAGAGVRANYPLLAKSAAKIKSKEAPKDVNKIITPCNLCFSNMVDEDSRVMEFSTFVLGKLRGMRR